MAVPLAAGYQFAVTMFSIELGMSALLFLFMSLGLLGITFKLKPDQDRKIIYLLTIGTFFLICHVLTALSMFWGTTNTDCYHIVLVLAHFSFPMKIVFYMVLVRKAELVQYNANAGKWAFRAIKFGIFLEFVKWMSNFADELNIGFAWYLADAQVYMCAIISHPANAYVQIAINWYVMLGCIYLFSKPLRAHLKEMQTLNTQGTVASNTAVQIGSILKRNLFVGVVSLLINLSVMVGSGIMGASNDYGTFLIILGCMPLESVADYMLTIYMCKNAWESKLPGGFFGYASTVAGSATGGSVGNSKEVSQGQNTQA